MITSSVGRNGINLQEDYLLVKKLLIQCGYLDEFTNIFGFNSKAQLHWRQPKGAKA